MRQRGRPSGYRAQFPELDRSGRHDGRSGAFAADLVSGPKNGEKFAYEELTWFELRACIYVIGLITDYLNLLADAFTPTLPV